MKTETETLEQEKTILFSDLNQEQKKENEINEQREKIQAAVDAFNETGLKPLQPEELVYFIQGREPWIEVRWQSEQEVPKGWPKNVDKTKFLSILERPDFSRAVAATSAISLIHHELFILRGDKILIDANIREQIVTQNRIYLEAEEQENYQKLQQLVRLLNEFGLLKDDSFAHMTGKVTPVDLNGTGLGYVAYSEDPFQFNPHKLKNFLSTIKV